jgi:hypothetical protein
MSEVKHLYAFIADGENSFVSMQMGNQHYPMVCVGEGALALPSMKRAAVQIAKATGRTIRMVKFYKVEEVEVFNP